ncbi:MAG TPA: RNA polymerase sigma factor [Kofleriaceae bacterium]|nr:RNA polymerase sigma factor [Kofleriaceae bacterium]
MGDPVEFVSRNPASLNAVLVDARPILERIAERMCASSADAADLVQDTIERAIRVGVPIDVQNPRAWLTTMLHNLFIDRCRSASRQPPHEPLDDTHDNVTYLDAEEHEPVWSRATLDDIRAALEQINPTFREVYVLHTFELRPYEEIAARLKISRVTVGTRLTRARLLLRKVLVARLGPEARR